MNITELRYLVAIMQWGSVSAAAKQLYAAQPNISKALKNLEEEYKIRIFERSSTGMIPTEQGRRFIEQAERVLEDVDLLSRSVEEEQERCAELRVMLPHATYASYAAVDYLEQAAHLEKMHIHIREGGSMEALDFVLRRGYHLALLRYAEGAEIVHDGAKKLLLEPLAPAEEPAAAPEDPRHTKKKKPGPAARCVGVRGTSGKEYRADAVLVATGGLSYPTTGSTGDGYRLAQQAGHTIVEPVPSLVSLVSHDPDCKKMMGLALKNVTLTLFEDGKAIFDEQGEMLFTHFGISGPLTLSASSHLGDMKKHKYHAEIDLKPALSEEQLYDRITRDFALLANHAAQGALVKLLPSSMQPVMVARWGIDPATKANQITREQKRELVHLCKHWKVPIDARGDLAHAVITSGGVSVREVDPKTMQSKKALGLYFAGEVLDVDAYTGGYNLQIAFCTAQSFANNL